ncbi:Transcriptional regulatory protein sin3 [Tulasnella sp. UAMH 9824]|nr:Transcriptional regulatory protein sin3 [Tulasnella sp. UAMH 9824]
MVVRRSTRRWDLARLPPRPEINFNTAISYVHEVQTVYTEQPSVYRQFLDIISYARGRGRGVNSIVATVEGITDLFGRHGHPELIRGFDKFLPAGIRLYLPESIHDDERLVLVIAMTQAADEIFEVLVPQPGSIARQDTPLRALYFLLFQFNKDHNA